MGYLPSSSTKTLYAYLTQKGRYNLLFENADKFKVAYFSLHDNDYRVASKIIYSEFNKLPKGFVPDITGDDNDCIRSIAEANIVDNNSYLIFGGEIQTPTTPPPPGTPPTTPPPSGTPPTTPPPPGSGPPPPSVQRTLPLILEFEYSSNRTLITDVWEHRLAFENGAYVPKIRWNFGEQVSINNSIVSNVDSKCSIVLKTSPGDNLPITQAERNAINFWLQLEIPLVGVSNAYIDQIGSLTSGEWRKYYLNSSNSSPDSKAFFSFSSITTNSLIHKINDFYFDAGDSWNSIINPIYRDIEFNFGLYTQTTTPNVVITSTKSKFQYKAKLQNKKFI